MRGLVVTLAAHAFKKHLHHLQYRCVFLGRRMGISNVSLSEVLCRPQCAVRFEEVLFAEVHGISQGAWDRRNGFGWCWGCWFRRVADLRIELALVEVERTRAKAPGLEVSFRRAKALR
jgi:hypothetical protein